MHEAFAMKIRVGRREYIICCSPAAETILFCVNDCLMAKVLMLKMLKEVCVKMKHTANSTSTAV